jgi:predicted O-methyltransferase YrrM
MQALLKKVARYSLKLTGHSSTHVKADRTLNVSELLFSENGGTIHLPLSPGKPKGRTQDDVEFAAASVLERVVLAALVKRLKAMHIFEIGTFRGITALAMATNAPEGSVLYTLDLPSELSATEIAELYYAGSSNSGFRLMAASGAQRSVGLMLQHYQGNCHIKQLFGDSAEMDFTPYRELIDLFFVDGCHDYDMAKHDTLTAWNCLRPGGTVVWHDYLWPSVQKAIRDSKLGVPISYVADTSLAFAQKPA